MLRITKDTLRKLNAAIGKLDTDTGQVVVGFIGCLEMSDRLYHGEMHYGEVSDDPPEDTVSIRAILLPESSAKPVKPAKSAKPDKPDKLTDKEK